MSVLGGLSRRTLAAIMFVAGAAVIAFIGVVVTHRGPAVEEGIFRTPSLHAAVSYDWRFYSDGFRSVVTEPEALRDELARVDGCRPLFDAAQRAGAFNIGYTVVRLTLEAARHNGVTITDIRPRILRRGAAKDGVRVYCQGGAVVGIAGLFFDLDEDEPSAYSVDADGVSQKPFFDRKAVVLEQGEVQPFRITARSSHDAVEWLLDVTVHRRRGEEEDDGEGRQRTRVPNDRPAPRVRGRRGMGLAPTAAAPTDARLLADTAGPAPVTRRRAINLVRSPDA